MTIGKLLFAVILTGISLPAFAQIPTQPKPVAMATTTVSNPTWTKRVSRLINIADTGNVEKRKLRDESNGVSLAELLIDNVLKGKIKAYTTTDSKMVQTMTLSQLQTLVNGVPDTIDVEDPVTGKILRKIVKRDFNYQEVTKFRVLEEWSFDKLTAKTTIQIVGVAPVKDVYGDDGTFRGRMSMFWLRYDEVKNILAQYEQNHPNANIVLAVWNNYFTEAQN